MILTIFVVIALLIYLRYINENINKLKKSVRRLEQQVRQITSGPTTSAPFKKSDVEVIPTTTIYERKEEPMPNDALDAFSKNEIKTTKSKEQTVQSERNLEKQFGMRLPVWIGSIALAFAGFYMVKYSIEIGLITPQLRLVLATLFSILLLASSVWINVKGTLNNGTRIAQAMAGAAIAILYMTIYAATNMYYFIPNIAGFVGMAGVTALAIILAINFGAPIAFLGVASGYLTPLLISGNDNATFLFSYLFVVLCASLVLVKKYDWWWLAIIVIAASFAWILGWMFFLPHAANNYVLSIFLLSVLAAVLYIAQNAPLILKAGTYTFALIIMLLLVQKSNFGSFEWLTYSILAAGTLVLTVYDFKTYNVFPYLSAVFTAVLLLQLQINDPQQVLLYILAFGALYAASAYLLNIFNKINELYWMRLAAIANVAFYMLAYYKIGASLSFSTDSFLLQHHWSISAGLFAIFWAYTTFIQYQPLENKALRDELFFTCFSATAAFVTICSMIEMNTNMFSILLAVELVVISWFSNRIVSSKFESLLQVFTILLIMSLAYQIFIEIDFYSKPKLYLLAPAVLVAVTCYQLRSKNFSNILNNLEWIAILLLAFYGPVQIYQTLNDYQSMVSVNLMYLNHALDANYLMILGLVALNIPKKLYQSVNLFRASVMLNIAALIMILYISTFIDNPLFHPISVGDLFIFNVLTLTYGVPVVWLLLATKSSAVQQRLSTDDILRARGVALLLSFIWLNFMVRQTYHGAYVANQATTNMEIYTYSIVWLLFGVSLLIAGALRQDKYLRIASLVLVVLTVCKVFLYDISALTGLLRILSFLGLGLCLMALSWFYAKFVFNKIK